MFSDGIGKSKVEWTKEFYQCVQCLQKEYIQPLEDKVKRLERVATTK